MRRLTEELGVGGRHSRCSMEHATPVVRGGERYAKPLDVVFPETDMAGIERTVKLLRDALGDERFGVAWSRGGATLEQAADEALG